MGSHLDQLRADMKAALKSGDRARLEVLRMLIADLQKRALERPAGQLSEEDEVAVLQKAVKTRADSVAQAQAAGRTDVADREQAEIAIVQEYLPRQMTAEEVAAKVRELAGEIGYAGPRDTGRFMKEWMARYKGLADGKVVQEALKGV